MVESRFQLPFDSVSVPDDMYGIYAFRLCLPNDARLGLTDPTANLQDRKLELMLRADRLGRALRGGLMSGEIQTQQARHLARIYEVTAAPRFDGSSADSFETLIGELGGGFHALRTAASVLRYSVELSLPLYVGMTASQSYRQRLEQHMAGSTQFSDRLKSIGVTWWDLQFVTRPLELPRAAVRAAERVAQSFLRPTVSLT